MFLLDDILLAPVKGIVWIGQQAQELVDDQLSDREGLRKKLLELQWLYEMDELGDEEYERQEADILDRLEELDRRDADER